MSASVRSRRAWGWHPLTDEWAARIVADAAVRPGELVLDIGAVHEALTAADLVLQRAVVRRYTSGRAADLGRWRRRWRLQVGRSLPRRAFRPAPRVDSAVLVVRRR